MRVPELRRVGRVAVEYVDPSAEAQARKYAFKCHRTVVDGVSPAVFVLDLRRVSSVNDVARRMLAEMLRRLQLDGAEVALLDPDHVLKRSTEDSRV